MAMEQSQPLEERRNIHFDLLMTLHQDDVFHYAGSRRAVYVGQFEAASVQVQRMNVVGLVVEHEAMAFSLRQPSRTIGIITLAVDGPRLEARLVSRALADDQRDHFLWA